MNEILELLQNDARLTPEEIATMIGRDVNDVKKQIAKMEKDNIIVKYSALINPEKAPNKKDAVQAVIEIGVNPERERGFDAIAERIYKFPQVKAVYLMSGGYDLHVEVEGKTLKEVAFFVSDKLATLENVNSTRTHFVLKKYKENDVILNGETAKAKRLKISA